MLSDVNRVLDRADFLWVDGVVFQTSYLRLCDDETFADDVLIEAFNEDSEVFLTKTELESGDEMGDGSVRLGNGSVVRFLSTATVH